MNKNPYAPLMVDVLARARGLRDAREQLLMPETLALLRAQLDPVADQLDAREQFSPMPASAQSAAQPLPGVPASVQEMAESYRASRKMDAMFGNPTGTAFRRSLEGALNEAYGLPAESLQPG